ncbi:HET-domain-containing protein [Trametes cingulata]|nr:HET-domain-containing protein [Trametes cingulata]
MWLLDTHTFCLEEVAHPNDVPSPGYAILSHVWIKVGRGEQSFQDIRNLTSGILSLPGVELDSSAIEGLCPKIRGFCALARRNGFRKVWIDTCCIDKTSSSEFSEAINSMYQWYARAAVCYAYLQDVPGEDDPRDTDSTFCSSEWFTRGWTLQELLAPSQVIFVSAEWQSLGTKTSFADIIQEITGIDRDVLTRERPLDSVSIARRMSWAASRRTTRVEDQAYCLMGIFGVNMPTIYGEGRQAFIRLQEEILKRSHDQSILAWDNILDDPALVQTSSDPDCILSPSVLHDGVDEEEWEQNRLLASSPLAFRDSGNVAPISPEDFADILGIPFNPPEYAVTSCGMRLRLPLLTLVSGPRTTHLGVLACRTARRPDHLVALFLVPQPRSPVCLVGRYARTTSTEEPHDVVFSRFRAFLLPVEHLRKARVTAVYVPYRLHEPSGAVQDVAPSAARRPDYLSPCAVELLPWVHARLRRAGYALRVDSAEPMIFDREHVEDRTIVLSPAQADGTEEIAVLLGLCYCQTRCCPYSKQSERGLLQPHWSLSAGISSSSARRSAYHQSGTGGVNEPPIDRTPVMKRHVRTWGNGAKMFRTASGAVTLKFELLSDVGQTTRYSLDIELQKGGDLVLSPSSDGRSLASAKGRETSEESDWNVITKEWLRRTTL